jgi:ABC-type molybdate transport system substrate-binding protein
MGDEGLQIYNVKKRSANRVAFLPWDTHEFETSVRDIIVKKCNRAPIVVLNDMVEQHYRKERIPKVSIIDRANVIKRRLAMAFPNYRVRAALKLKDKKSPAAGDQKGDPYLFAAIPASDSFKKTLEAINLSAAPIVGFYLLPVEASAMVKALSSKLAKGKGFRPIWSIFIGQHHNGGLRQIVTRNGELALTRLTPIVDTDVEPDLWAKEVSGELDATMSYLSRFGYKPTDGLDIIISANEASKPSLEQVIQVEADLHIMNATDIAELLGTGIGVQEDLRYADPIHTVYLGNKRRFQLPLEALSITQLTQPRKIFIVLMLCLLAGCAYFGFTAFQNWKKSVEIQDQLIVAQQKNRAIQAEYNVELDKQKALGFDFRSVSNSIEIYKELETKKLKPLPLIRDIGKALGVDVHLDKLKITLETENVKSAGQSFQYGADKEEKHFMNALLTISFPSSINPDISVRRVNSIRDKLEEIMPSYKVEIIKQVADLSYTGNFTGGSGTSSRSQKPEKYEAEIVVRGELK